MERNFLCGRSGCIMSCSACDCSETLTVTSVRTTHGRWTDWRSQPKQGAGPTPYSRTADGRAVMRSSVREFIASEAMAALGVPTTRALSLVATGKMVTRDMFYKCVAIAVTRWVPCVWLLLCIVHCPHILRKRAQASRWIGRCTSTAAVDSSGAASCAQRCLDVRLVSACQVVPPRGSVTTRSSDCLSLGACSGNIRDEPGAVVCRMSASFIRFGTFQLPASREEFHNIPRLADYVIRHHYPQFEGTGHTATMALAHGAARCHAIQTCLDRFEGRNLLQMKPHLKHVQTCLDLADHRKVLTLAEGVRRPYAFAASDLMSRMCHGRRGAEVRGAADGGGRAHCASGGGVAERWLRARRAQHGQHVHTGRDHRLRVWNRALHCMSGRKIHM